MQGHKAATPAHLRAVAPMALRHRLRRNPLDDTGSGTRVERALTEVLGA
jgi:magnesium chelatase subunit I